MELKKIIIILKIVLLLPTIYIGYIIKEVFIIKEYSKEYDEILEMIPKVLVISTIILYIILKEKKITIGLIELYRNIKIDKLLNKLADINYKWIKKYNKEMESTIYEKISILEIYRKISEIYIIIKRRKDFARNNYSLYYIIYSMTLIIFSSILLLYIILL